MCGGQERCCCNLVTVKVGGLVMMMELPGADDFLGGDTTAAPALLLELTTPGCTTTSPQLINCHRCRCRCRVSS